ncbi:MAG: FtsX-like permease family protein [Vicinamibacterales bacterium]
MVTRRPRISALNRKLLRDVWHMKGQAAAVAMVIAAGVTMFIAYFSNFESLQRTRATFYERSQFADVFASLTRAPGRVAEQLADLPGVASVDTRVVTEVTLDLEDMREPASGRLVSLPSAAGVALNQVYVRRGRWVDPARPDEVLVSERFAEAHGFDLGTRITALINGRRRTLTIVGVALSPEYVYAIRAGDLFPDFRRFGVLWMNRPALAAALDMTGGFNDVAVAMTADATEAEVIAGIDRLLEPYGGRGAIPQSLQLSAWMLNSELAQLQTFGIVVPVIFLGVAAFILHISLSRMLTQQRPQVATLKALGYTNGELAGHYITWALIVGTAGASAGIVAGAWAGAGFISLYNAYFRFPSLDYQLSITVAVASLTGSLVVAALGALAAVRRAVLVPPAEAMRPESPRLYRVGVLEGMWRFVRLGAVGRMLLRNLASQPVRAAMSTFGIALAVAVIFVGLAFVNIMETLIDGPLIQAMRQDATITLTSPTEDRAVFDARHLPGVLEVEPLRSVPVRLRAGARSRALALTGLSDAPRFSRVVDSNGRAIGPPLDGLLLSRKLAEVLGVEPGDPVDVELLEGHRTTGREHVGALVDDAIGLNAYIRLDRLDRLVRSGPLVNGMAVTVDAAKYDDLFRAITLTPAVAGIGLRQAAIQNFRDTMAENMNLSIGINVLFAAIIAFGVVYNSARVSLSERSHELASLRVLGFTRGEISFILLGELTVLTALALPAGVIIGYGLGEAIMLAFDNEVYRLSFTASAETVAWSWLTVMAATVLSALLVRRRLDRLDLVAVLKAKE